MSPISASSKRSKDFDRFDIHENLILILHVPINTMCKSGIGTAYLDGLDMGENRYGPFKDKNIDHTW